MNPPVVIAVNKKQAHTQSPSAYIDYFLDNERATATGINRSTHSSLQELFAPSICVVYHNENSQMATWEARLSSMSRLKSGWNGYTAPAPSQLAIATARNFVSALLREKQTPNRVAPSAVGGVGITERRADKQVYVEFYNDGRVLALFSDSVSEPEVRRLEPTLAAYKRLIADMQGYLDG